LFYNSDLSEIDISEALSEKTGLECYAPVPYEYFYVGRSYDEIKDDETGKQFKDSVTSKLKKFFGEDVKCSTCEEAWYDG
jgi:hypothetical protein